MYDDILIPTDGSRGMKRVAKHALKLAESCEATVHVLYVVDERPTRRFRMILANGFGKRSKGMARARRKQSPNVLSIGG